MSPHAVLVLARFTLLETARTRMLRMGVLILAVLALGGTFVGELAVTESARMRTALLAASTRMAIVFVVCLHVAQFITREHGDRTLDLILGRALSRADYVVGRLLGFVALGWAYTFFAACVIARGASLDATLVWACGLGLEFTVLAAMALFAAVALGQLVPAVSVTFAFYLLARSASSLQGLAHAATTAHGPGARTTAALSDLMMLMLPDLSQFVSTSSLLGEAPRPRLAYPAVQTLVYVVVLVSAAVLDFRRKDL